MEQSLHTHKHLHEKDAILGIFATISIHYRQLSNERNEDYQGERITWNSTYVQTEGVEKSGKREGKGRKETNMVQEWWIRLCPLCSINTGEQTETLVPEGNSEEWIQDQSGGNSKCIPEKPITNVKSLQTSTMWKNRLFCLYDRRGRKLQPRRNHLQNRASG